MAQLIQMRQRIKAIETIKKITHAMRLIAMSTHSRLKSKEDPLRHYQQEISRMFIKVQQRTPEWQNNLTNPITTEHNVLVILIGSQKGLCGNFNTMLFNHFEHFKKQYNLKQYSTIAVGKRAVDYVHKFQNAPLIGSYEEISSGTISSIAHQITHIIAGQIKPFSRVLVASNYLKTFFSQKPQVVTLIPFDAASRVADLKPKEAKPTESGALEDYIWEQKPDDVLDMLAEQCIDANLQYLLFQSLLAEHAARFISMDSSTRNAQNLLETTKLDYNKLRQAKITKELSELVGSF